MLATYFKYFKVIFLSLLISLWTVQELKSGLILSICVAGLCPASINYQKASPFYIGDYHLVPVRFEFGAENCSSGCLWRILLYCFGCWTCHIHSLKAVCQMSYSSGKTSSVCARAQNHPLQLCCCSKVWNISGCMCVHSHPHMLAIPLLVMMLLLKMKY